MGAALGKKSDGQPNAGAASELISSDPADPASAMAAAGALAAPQAVAAQNAQDMQGTKLPPVIQTPKDWPYPDNFPYPWPKRTNITAFNQQEYVEGMLFRDAMDHPVGRTIVAVVAGGVMGAGFGLVFIGLEPPNMAAQEMTTMQTLKDGARRAWGSAKGNAKNFSVFGGLYGGSECVIERFRGCHDIWNSVMAGCFTGAGVSRGAGPQGMAMGCVGCAAFSALIDKYMGFS